MDLIGKSCHLEEATVFSGHFPGAPLKRVQYLLAGHFDHAHCVAERMYFQYVSKRDIACRNIYADTAAVDKCYIRSALIQISVCAQITKVRLCHTDDPDRVAVTICCFRIIDHKIDRGLGDNLIQRFIQFSCSFIDFFRHTVAEAQKFGCRHFIGPGIYAGLNAAVFRTYARISDPLHLRSAGTAVHIPAILVLHDDLVKIMAVSVQEHVDSRRVADHIRIGPGLALRFISQMSHDKYIIRAFSPGIIHCCLYGIVHTFSGIILQEAVDEIALFILEILRRGGRQCLRCCHTDKGNLDIIELLDDVRVKDQFSFFIEVAADVGELCHLCQFQETVHAIIKLMIAGDRDLISHFIHQFDAFFTGRHCSQGFTLYGVSVIHEYDVIPGRFHLLFDGLQANVAKSLINSAVHVARK